MAKKVVCAAQLFKNGGRKLYARPNFQKRFQTFVGDPPAEKTLAQPRGLCRCALCRKTSAATVCRGRACVWRVAGCPHSSNCTRFHSRIGVAAHQSMGDRLAVAFGALWSRHGSSVLAANRGTDGHDCWMGACQRRRGATQAEHARRLGRRCFTLIEANCPPALDSQKPALCVKQGVCLCLGARMCARYVWQRLLKAAFLVGEQKRALTEGLAVLQLSRVSPERAHECGCPACLQRAATEDECVVAQARNLFFVHRVAVPYTPQADVLFSICPPLGGRCNILLRSC